MAANFDDFYSNVKKKFPDAGLDEIRSVYESKTGEPAYFQNAPVTREQWRKNLQSTYKDMSDSEANAHYDRLYSKPTGTAIKESAERGLYGLGSTAAGLGVQAADALGIDSSYPAQLKARAEAAAAAIPPSPSGSQQMFPGGFDYRHPIDSLGKGNYADTVGNPNYWAEQLPSMGVQAAPMLAAAVGASAAAAPVAAGEGLAAAAPSIASMFAGPAAAGAVNALQQDEATYAAAKAKGLPDPQQRGLAQGAIGGLLGAIPLVDVGLQGPLNVLAKMIMGGVAGTAQIPSQVVLEDAASLADVRDPVKRNAMAAKIAEEMGQAAGPSALLGAFDVLGQPRRGAEAVKPAADAGAQLRAGLGETPPPDTGPPPAVPDLSGPPAPVTPPPPPPMPNIPDLAGTVPPRPPEPVPNVPDLSGPPPQRPAEPLPNIPDLSGTPPDEMPHDILPAPPDLSGPEAPRPPEPMPPIPDLAGTEPRPPEQPVPQVPDLSGPEAPRTPEPMPEIPDLAGTQRAKEGAPSVQDLHDLIKAKDIPNDEAFLDRTEAVTGERHLDNLDPAQRTKLYDEINRDESTRAAEPKATYDAGTVGEIRRSDDGRIYGGPKGLTSQADFDATISHVIKLAVDPMSVPNVSHSWYEDTGRDIAARSGADPVLREKMLRLAAYFSQSTSLGGNAKALVDAAFQIARGEPIRGGRFPNVAQKDIPKILAAKEMDKALPGISDKIMSFYRNLKDGAGPVGADEYPHESTIDRWMWHVLGYKGGKEHKAGSVQYAYARAVMKAAADKITAQTGRPTLPRQVQAMLWTHARNLEDVQKLEKNVRAARAAGNPVKSAAAEAQLRAFKPTSVHIGDYLEHNTAMVSAEAVPSKSSPLYATFEKIPPSQHEAFFHDAFNLMRDVPLHLPLSASGQGVGVWEGVRNPNIYTAVQVPGGVGAPEMGNAHLLANIQGHVWNQDAVLVHRPNFFGNPADAKTAVGARIVVRAGDISTSEMASALQREGIIALSEITRNGVREFRVLRLADDDEAAPKSASKKQKTELAALKKSRDDAFLMGVRNTLNTVGLDVTLDLHAFRADAALPGAGENGEGYLARLGEAGRPDLQEWARSRRSDFEALVHRYAGEEAPARHPPGGEPGRVERPVEDRSAGAAADQVNAPSASYEVQGRQPAGESGGRAGVDRPAPQLYSQRVGLRRTGEIPIGVTAVHSPADAAHVLAGIRKKAQEEVVALVTDRDGVPLKVIRHSIGTQNASQVEKHTLLGAALSVPHGANVWFAHNHPSGRDQLSDSDMLLTDSLRHGLEGTHLNSQGMLVVVPGGARASFYDGERMPSHVATTAKARTFGKVPVVEREFTNAQSKPEAHLDSAGKTEQFVKDKQPGVVLLDFGNQVRGYVNGFDKVAIAQAAHATGAHSIIAKGSRAEIGAARQAAREIGMSVLDAVGPNGSMRASGELAAPPAREADAAEQQAKYDPGTEPNVDKKTHIELGGGRYNTHKFLDALTSDDVNLLDHTMQQFAGDVETQRRGTRTWGMTDEAAAKMSNALKTLSAYTGLPESQLLKKPMLGDTANAETLQLYASRVVEATKALKEQAARVATGDASPQAVLDYEAAKRNLAVWFTPFSGFVSESARALNSMRQFARMYGDAKNMMAALGEDVAGDAMREAKQIANLDETAIGKRMRTARPTDFLDKVLEFRSAMMLYGPLTDIRNIAGNGVNAMLEILNAYGAQAIGKLRGTPGASFAVANAQARGMIRGITMGWANAGSILRTGVNPLDAVSKVDPGQAREAIPGTAGKITRFAFRKLEAEDALFKGIGFMGSLHASAMADAIKEGGNVGDVNARAQLLLDRWNTAFKNGMELTPHEQAVLKEAIDYSRKLTFQSPLGPAAGMLNAWMSQGAGRLAKIPVPFFKTSVNILKTAYEYSPLGFLGARTKDLTPTQQNALLSRATIGSGLAVAAWVAAASGLMTGGISDDPARRKMEADATGMIPYAIRGPLKPDGTHDYRSYSFLEPAGTLMGMITDLHDLATTREFKDIPDAASQLMGSVMTNVGDKTWMQGIGQIAQAWSDPGRFASNYVNSTISSFVPNLSSQIASSNDPYLRQANTLMDAIKKKIPGLRNQLAAKMGITGQPEPNLTQSMVAPYAKSVGVNNPVVSTMVDLGVTKSAPSQTIMGVKLSDADYADYTAFVGQLRYRALYPVVTSPGFLRAPDIVQAQYIDKKWEEIGTKARLAWLMQHKQVLKDVTERKRHPPPKSETAGQLLGDVFAEPAAAS